MNTNSINNAQNSYALYNTSAQATTQSSTTTTQNTNTTASTADTVTISPEALALQQAAAGADSVIIPTEELLGVGQGHGVRPPL